MATLVSEAAAWSRFKLDGVGGICDVSEIEEAESSMISCRSGLPGRVERADTAEVEFTAEPKTCVTLARGLARDFERKDEGLEWDLCLPSLSDSPLIRDRRARRFNSEMPDGRR